MYEHISPQILSSRTHAINNCMIFPELAFCQAQNDKCPKVKQLITEHITRFVVWFQGKHPFTFKLLNMGTGVSYVTP